MDLQQRTGLHQGCDALTAAVGRGVVDVPTVLSALIEVAKREHVELSRTQSRRGSRGQLDPSDVRKAIFDGNRLAVVRDLPATPMRFAKCCNPEADGPIVALWMGRGIASIHKSACARLSEHDDVRILRAAWVGAVGAPQWARSTDCDVLVTALPVKSRMTGPPLTGIFGQGAVGKKEVRRRRWHGRVRGYVASGRPGFA